MDIKDRLKEIRDYAKMGQTNFEKHTGISSGYFNKVKGSIGSDTILKIVNKFPELNLDWLITGKGEMLKPVSSAPSINYEHKGSPYYDVDFIGGFDIVLNSQAVNPNYYIDFEPYNKQGVMWCNITGHSMEPAINHGDMIAIKEVQDWRSYLTFGEIYAIVTTNDMRTVKKIRKGNTTEQYRLIPINTIDYDEQDIEKIKISKVFEVLGCMKRF
ncbi:LexA family transcriptional regulator [Parabacteroides faecis]|uniref:S24 family peptidase n=1 Tax=Parabacteroides TaxID=375288 RepID=UPI000EFE8E0C|nr:MULTISPECIES: S24 family peptidase [Parabacteroides]MBC8618926.1 LexA family transcriptional regulator [Parabacteroides faecis]RHS00047.1 LexA family transcriptional regulator [Parabacteroides sp. AF14-59]